MRWVWDRDLHWAWYSKGFCRWQLWTASLMAIRDSVKMSAAPAAETLAELFSYGMPEWFLLCWLFEGAPLRHRAKHPKERVISAPIDWAGWGTQLSIAAQILCFYWTALDPNVRFTNVGSMYPFVQESPIDWLQRERLCAWYTETRPSPKHVFLHPYSAFSAGK